MAVPSGIDNLRASSRDGGVHLTWDDPDDSTITKLQYRYLALGSTDFSTWLTYTDIPLSADGEDNHESYTVTGLTNGTTYAFDVRAVNDDGNSTGNSQTYGQPLAPPDELEGFKVTPGDEELTLSWDNPLNSSITKIEYRSSPVISGTDFDYTAIPNSAAGSANHTSYTITGLTADTVYGFDVRAVNPTGTSSETDFVSAAPYSDEVPDDGGFDGAFPTGLSGPAYNSVTETVTDTTGATVSASETISLPTHDSGDLLVATVYRAPELPLPTDAFELTGPTGWTRVLTSDNSTDTYCDVWAKIGDGTETSADWTNPDSKKAAWLGHVARITGAASTVDDAIVQAIKYNGEGHVQFAEGPNVQTAGSLVLYGASIKGGDCTEDDVDSLGGFQGTLQAHGEVVAVDASDDGHDGHAGITGFASSVSPTSGGRMADQPFLCEPVRDYSSYSLVIAPPKPAAITGLTAEAGVEEVTLTWDAPEDSSVTKYYYQVHPSSQGWDYVGIPAPGEGEDANSYTVTGLSGATPRTFVVSASNGKGLSDGNSFANISPKEAEQDVSGEEGGAVAAADHTPIVASVTTTTQGSPSGSYSASFSADLQTTTPGTSS